LFNKEPSGVQIYRNLRGTEADKNNNSCNTTTLPSLSVIQTIFKQLSTDIKSPQSVDIDQRSGIKNPDPSIVFPSTRKPLFHSNTPAPTLQPPTSSPSPYFISFPFLSSSTPSPPLHHPPSHPSTMADPDPSKWRKKRDPNLPPPPNPNARTSTPKPNPLGNNPGFQNFDLSDDQFTSDGEDQYWPTNKTRIADKEFLRMLTKAYNERPDLVRQWSACFPSLPSPFPSTLLPPLLKIGNITDARSCKQAANQSTSKANHLKATLCSSNPTTPSMDTPAA
jgi:hypothetical protein